MGFRPRDPASKQRASETRRYLRTGDSDPLFSAWPGNIIERGQAARKELSGTLVAEVQRRSEGLSPPALLPDIDLCDFVRQKVEPMVRGLFPARERDVVLKLLANSVIFLTPDNLDAVLWGCSWLRTAWDLANLYLMSVGAELLAADAPTIVGSSVDTRCYVSLEYFACEDRFADFIVHETAHIFHNCKRRTAGLPEMRTCEWLIELEFRKRETFAYACEAYSRILELAKHPADRKTLLAELREKPTPNDDRVDGDEYLDILHDALAARNGWKRILARCSTQ